MKKNKTIAALLGVITLAAITLSATEKTAETKPAETNKTGAAAKSAELFPDTVVAKGKGVEIKRSQLDDAFTELKAGAASRGQNILDSQREWDPLESTCRHASLSIL